MKPRVWALGLFAIRVTIENVSVRERRSRIDAAFIWLSPWEAPHPQSPASMSFKIYWGRSVLVVYSFSFTSANSIWQLLPIDCCRGILRVLRTFVLLFTCTFEVFRSVAADSQRVYRGPNPMRYSLEGSIVESVIHRRSPRFGVLARRF